MAKTIVLPQYKWKLGSHVPIYNTIYDTTIIATELGFGAFQFFLGSPYSFNRKNIDKEDIEKTRERIDIFNLKIFSHSPYIHNLSGSVKCACWDGNTSQDSKTLSSLKSLQNELAIMAQLKGGVVIHPGSHPDKNKCIASIIKSINKISFPENSLLLLENTAGEGNKMPKTIEDIALILNGISSKENIGVCIDTAHIHGQGDYNLSIVSQVDLMFNDIIKQFGIERVKLIHLNDSEVKLGSKKDRHEVVGKGEIWGNDKSGLKRLIEYCIKYNIPTIMETTSMDISLLEKINMEINEENINDIL